MKKRKLPLGYTIVLSVVIIACVIIHITADFSGSNECAGDGSRISDFGENISAGGMQSSAESKTDFGELELNSENTVFYSASERKYLYKKASTEKIYPASLTKILTACTALKYLDSQTVFKVGSELELVEKGSSLCLLKQGFRLTLEDLITGMLMASGNDAAYTIAVNTARAVAGKDGMGDKKAVKYFCTLMNDLAKDIGMKNSNFTNPDGWDDKRQYSTAEDLAVLAVYADGIDEISEIVSLEKKHAVFESGQNITWTNSNALLNPESRFYCKYAVGMKTGTTSLAGKCIIAVVKKQSKKYIAVVAGCDTDEDRYRDVIKLVNETEIMS